MSVREDPEEFPLLFLGRDSGQVFQLITSTWKVETDFNLTPQSPHPRGTRPKLSGIPVRPSGLALVTFPPVAKAWRACFNNKTTFWRAAQSFLPAQDHPILHPEEAAKVRE